MALVELVPRRIRNRYRSLREPRVEPVRPRLGDERRVAAELYPNRLMCWTGNVKREGKKQ